MNQLKILKQSIEKYDFEKAQVYLKKTAELMGITLEVEDEQ
jgi:hypothetical protein